MPDFSLHGKVALITGAGRGIGLAIGKALTAAGCAVALQDIEQDVAEAKARKLGGRSMALGGDIRDLAVVATFVGQVVEKLGGLHILINNAAIQSEKHWTQYTPDEIEEQWRANLVAPIVLCQQAVPVFRRQSWGRILNVGSIQQQRGNPKMLPYAMGKAALENMTIAMARDLAADGITVNLLAPGYFNTHRNRDHLRTGADLARAGKWVPAGRVGEPEDAAGAALLFCSEAGKYITGQTIYVDGGMSVRAQ